MNKLIVALRNFANAPKKAWSTQQTEFIKLRHWQSFSDALKIPNN